MFQNWGFLLTEIWALLLLAALLGLFAGWLIWSRRQKGETQVEADLRTALRLRDQRIGALESELVGMQGAGQTGTSAADHVDQSVLLADLRAQNSDLVADRDRFRTEVAGMAALQADLNTAQEHIAALEAEAERVADIAKDKDAVQVKLAEQSRALEEAQHGAARQSDKIAVLEAQVAAVPTDLAADLSACRDAGATKDRRIAELEAALADMATANPLAVGIGSATSAAPATGLAESPGSAPVAPPTDYASQVDMLGDMHSEGVKPDALDAPRDNKADDLKRIKGIGPKLEKLCNQLGFWHFDQIASWSSEEVAWVDQHLEGFKGRVSRDNWVDQAGLLASGGETEFSKRVDGGDVCE